MHDSPDRVEETSGGGAATQEGERQAGRGGKREKRERTGERRITKDRQRLVESIGGRTGRMEKSRKYRREEEDRSWVEVDEEEEGEHERMGEYQEGSGERDVKKRRKVEGKERSSWEDAGKQEV